MSWQSGMEFCGMGRLLRLIAVVLVAACMAAHANRVWMNVNTNDGSFESWSSVLTNSTTFSNSEDLAARRSGIWSYEVNQLADYVAAKSALSLEIDFGTGAVVLIAGDFDGPSVFRRMNISVFDPSGKKMKTALLESPGSIHISSFIE